MKRSKEQDNNDPQEIAWAEYEIRIRKNNFILWDTNPTYTSDFMQNIMISSWREKHNEQVVLYDFFAVIEHIFVIRSEIYRKRTYFLGEIDLQGQNSIQYFLL